MTREMGLPNPLRVGGPGWIEATGGKLTWNQRRTMLGASFVTQLQLVSQKVSRRGSPVLDIESLMQFPDSRLIHDAKEAALCQSPAILAHGYRSAVFARALVRIDQVKVDDEELIVCALLHDAGLVPAVKGQDFTLRSARLASDVAKNAGAEESCTRLYDAICVHTTVGVTVEKDGALGAYTQFGAMVDLAGLRERHLPYNLVHRVVTDYPRDGFVKEILTGLHGEARAVPGGRFSFLKGVGFSPAVRMAAVPSRK